MAAMKLGLIGCGKMGTALVAGAIKAGAIPAADVTGCGRSDTSRESFEAATGARTVRNVADLAAECDTLVLATKPADARTVLQLASEGAKGKPRLVISLAAGLTTESLEDALPESFRVVRTMPNTPSLVGKGASAFCRGRAATEDDARAARLLLGSTGLALEVPEHLMDAVTGLSGSGPAYIYLIIEAMADAGVKAGLSRKDSIQLAAQTTLGAAAMVLETGEHPAVLKDMVTSPGGTTIAALAEMERLAVRSALISAVEASVNRAKELGRR